jgi:hypothetical protein
LFIVLIKQTQFRVETKYSPKNKTLSLYSPLLREFRGVKGGTKLLKFPFLKGGLGRASTK